MFGIGTFELVVIFVMALIFIGPSKLPQLARGLGRGLREFQRAKSDITEGFLQEEEKQSEVPKAEDKS